MPSNTFDDAALVLALVALILGICDRAYGANVASGCSLLASVAGQWWHHRRAARLPRQSP